MSTLVNRVGRAVPMLLLGIAFLAAWQTFVEVQDIKPFLLPKPTAIWTQIVDQHSQILTAARNSGTNAFVGLIVGTVLGVVMAAVSSRIRTIREMVVPLAAAVNVMPIIALAPILNNIFSSTSSIPRRTIVTMVVFFPIFVNVLRGLSQIDPVQDELMRSYAASDTVTLLKVRVPSALPHLFTGLKLAASLCVISAVVSEYFGGLQNGLGNRIASAASNSATPRAWAYVAGSCALGLVFFLGANLLERLAMPWRAKRANSI
ncbi:MAG: ABC transporter permease [Acidimicrobiia bacterium]